MRPGRARRRAGSGQASGNLPKNLPKYLGERRGGLAGAPMVEGGLGRADDHAGDQARIQIAVGVGACPVGNRSGQRDLDR